MVTTMAPAMSSWRRSPFSLFSNNEDSTPSHLGILSFDTAKTISRLISVYRSLSDREINHLRKETMKSKGVSYLNSDDEGFLLTLACAERLEELDHAATVLTFLAHRCTDPALIHFDTVYRDLKLGVLDHDKLAHSYASKEMERSVDKMEKRISITSHLYTDLQGLAELEASEKRVNEFKRTLKAQSQSQTTTNNGTNNNNNNMKNNVEQFEQKLAALRKSVKHLKESSLWCKSYDKILGFMARVVCVSYARICVHFRPYVGVLPSVSGFRAKGVRGGGSNSSHPQDPFIMRLFEDPTQGRVSWSGPLVGGGNASTGSSPEHSKAGLVRFFSGNSNIGLGLGFGFGTGCSKSGSNRSSAASFMSDEDCTAVCYNNYQSNKNKVYQAASPSTVGGSGLAIRYANLVVVAERFLERNSAIREQDRDDLYSMLPASLRSQVKLKLKRSWKKLEMEVQDREIEEDLAMGWRDAAEGILQWLGPMANDTLAWHAERNMERQKFEAGASVLLLQTLHFSDLEKTEAAIVEVLVGLSYICRFENRRMADDEDGSY